MSIDPIKDQQAEKLAVDAGFKSDERLQPIFASDDLKDRVQKFLTFQLPGQPQGMHIGTFNLVTDLWREIQRLQDDNKSAPCNPNDPRPIWEQGKDDLKRKPFVDEGGISTGHAATNEYLTLRDANIARQAEWDPIDAIGLSLIELSAAIGGLANMIYIIKKRDRETLGLRWSRVDLADLAAEFGDVLICLDLVSMNFHIDLDQAIKDRFNQSSIKCGLKTRLV